MRSFKLLLIFSSVSVAMLLTFQNCGNIGLKQNQVMEFASTGIEGTLCSALNGPPSSIKTFMVLNLTAKMVNGQYQADSDSDGLSDVEENSISEPVFDPLNRSTFGGLLDGQCLLNGALQCDSGSQSFLPDGDDDGLPDFIEALKGTSLITKDALIDVDQDGMNTLNEIINNRNPSNDADAGVAANSLVEVSYFPIDSAECPSGQRAYGLKIGSVALVNTQAIANSAKPEFDHGAGENILGIFFLSQPDDPTDGPVRLYYKLLKVNGTNSSLSIVPQDFGLWQ